jgi:peptidoglycan hydrolase-like protein with peptidoglycan-binding domain
MITLGHSVGGSGKNKPVDVMIVQHLLNLNHEEAKLNALLEITGDLDATTSGAIRSFQRNAMGSKTPDGRVDPGGRTLTKLAQPVKTSTTVATLRSVVRASWSATLARPAEVSSTLSVIDDQRFLGLYDRQFVQLGAGARAGLTQLIGFINADYEIGDVGWCAYMLATVKHECAERWRPIEEFGHGAGQAYGNPVTVTDKDGNKYANTYYGRGYVQLTWKDNYASLGQALGVGDSLLIDPAKTLDPETAYAIMSYGMRNGSFTGKRLSDYINQNLCDYPNARQIINGLDQHTKIAGYATDVELLVRVSCYGSVSDSTF